ncbi:MAG: DUF1816 domain-containing protein [Chroococcidiopsidaceae cyanobacterium CP_BM_RX_35]|nr:DUF1816 domain-containing protein [Chroococcidiopsidaceae cyanobacterium CP_BM_RX_35]
MKNFWSDLKETLVSFLYTFGWAWWVEIVTQNPRCTYYFGPFASAKEANIAKPGYLEDLEQEGATEITVTVKRCKPDNLTISDDLDERINHKQPVFSGQT